MHRAKRCGAKTRTGKLCQSPAMPNGRCRMHGGPSPGAPRGNRNAFKHGRYTVEAIARRREISALLRLARSLGVSTAHRTTISAGKILEAVSTREQILANTGGELKARRRGEPQRASGGWPFGHRSRRTPVTVVTGRYRHSSLLTRDGARNHSINRHRSNTQFHSRNRAANAAWPDPRPWHGCLDHCRTVHA